MLCRGTVLALLVDEKSLSPNQIELDTDNNDDFEHQYGWGAVTVNFKNGFTQLPNFQQIHQTSNRASVLAYVIFPLLFVLY